MKVLVTGATGFVGHQLALKLAGLGNCVQVLARDPLSWNCPKHERIQVFKGDITQMPTIVPALSGCEQVFHTAAHVKLWSKDPGEFYRVNVDGTRNILNAAREQGVAKLVFTSTCGVLGPSIHVPVCETDPRSTGFSNDYEFSKLLAENLVKEYCEKGSWAVIVSPSKVYGPGGETHPVSVNRVLKAYVKGRMTFIPRPSSLLANYCFVDDVVDGHILAMENGKPGEKYILGGENISYKDLFRVLRDVSRVDSRIVEVPRFLVEFLGVLQWLQSIVTGKEPYFSPRGVRHIYCDKAYCSDKAVAELGYRPTPLRDALQQTINYFKNNSHA